MTPENGLSFVERYGSFGLLVVLILAFVFYVIPRAIHTFQEITEKFDKALEQERAARADHDDRANKTLADLTAVVSQLVDRLERVEEHTSGCPHSTQPQQQPAKYRKPNGGNL